MPLWSPSPYPYDPDQKQDGGGAGNHKNDREVGRMFFDHWRFITEQDEMGPVTRRFIALLDVRIIQVIDLGQLQTPVFVHAFVQVSV